MTGGAWCMYLDGRSPVPLYYQLKEILRQEIESGTWQPDQQIPTEADLCRQYGVSRATVRQALAVLVSEGVLYRRQGRGTFVSPAKVEQNLLGFYSFTREMVERGWAPSSRVLSADVVKARTGTARLLGIQPGAPVVRLVRLRLVRDEPLILETTYLPSDLCPGLENEDLERQLLYDVLTKKYGLKLTGAKKYVEPVLVDQYEAQILGVKRGSPALLLERVTYADQRPVALCKWVVRGDRCRHYIDLDRLQI